MLLNIAISVAVILTAVVVFLPGLRANRSWRAMTTPLASIIGSGFLVLGPILNSAYGAWAPLAMALLCAMAWGFGAAIRFSMHASESDAPGPEITALENLSSWALGFAYIISVAYYLNLFGAFSVSLTAWDSEIAARGVTSAVFAVILITGWTKGFSALERMEYVSVGLKLAIIAGLLLGLAVFFGDHVQRGSLLLSPPQMTGWPAVTLAFGLIVTVQGFETARYLGEEYDRPTRERAMRWAQILSSVIYLAYIALIAYAFAPAAVETDETAIIGMMRQVAPVLPFLLVAAALAAQFSAAVADTSGAGGLMSEVTRGKLSPRRAYLVLVLAGLALTWVADIYQIISYASRAFALYYALQAAIACRWAWRHLGRADSPWQGHWRPLSFAALAALGVAIVIFGRSLEG
ncbi:hypothetical protein [Phaeovulum sp. W22_SRMD_FR3]|uniref:hypothetical protein n=1 Tax=Phaeovulum sp. W22_SRMD_FR3 TaxID=3240274 RepID=UPI003F9D2017